MALLIHENTGKEYPISNNLIIGRADPLNEQKPDIELNDKTVSRRHAVLQIIDDRIQIENLGRNGTLVNGIKITEVCNLKNNDIIKIEKEKFRFVDSQQSIRHSETIIDEGLLHKKEEKQSENKSKNTRLVTGCAAGIIIIVAVMFAVFQKNTSVISGTSKKEKNSAVEQLSETIDPQQAQQKATEYCAIARKYYSEKNISLENRSLAMGHYKKALDMYCTAHDSAGCAKITADTCVISAELDTLYENARKKGVIAFNQKNYELAAEHMRTIMGLFPDAAHPRNMWAKKNLLVLKTEE